MSKTKISSTWTMTKKMTYKKLGFFHLQKIPSVSRNSDQYEVHNNIKTLKPESSEITETDMAPSKLQQPLFYTVTKNQKNISGNIKSKVEVMHSSREKTSIVC